jgi:hypothetical protein
MNPKMPFFEDNKQQVHQAKESFDYQVALEESHLHATLHVLYQDYINQQVSKQKTLERFVKTMENFTLYFIHLLERCLWTMFHADMVLGQVALENVLTPNATPDCSVFQNKEQYDLFFRVSTDFFTKKQAMMNAKLENASAKGTYKPQSWFDLEALSTRHTSGSGSSTLYNGYLSMETAWEYFCFLDVDGMLQG